MATMMHVIAMASEPLAVLDLLNSLLEAEVSSIFRFMGEGSPYLTRASAQVRRPLEEMVRSGQRHARELAHLIEHLGGVPQRIPGVRADDQYLAFLSLKFLLPKLVEAKKLIIQRYENALAALAEMGDVPPQASSVVRSLLAEHQSDLLLLSSAAAEVSARRNE